MWNGLHRRRGGSISYRVVWFTLYTKMGGGGGGGGSAHKVLKGAMEATYERTNERLPPLEDLILYPRQRTSLMIMYMLLY